MEDINLIQCYNRGCGLKYNPKDNKEDSCRHHPGEPFFHDAYKGWTCCNKKCIDFTEFLNIQGCTLSSHSNIKPPEPEKPKRQEMKENEIIEVKPIVRNFLPRPPFDTPLVSMKPEVAPSFKHQVSQKQTLEDTDTNEVNIGTTCKNGGCKVTYNGVDTDNTKCIYHTGYAVFHEGLKFWSCCKKRTSDFQAFLDQVGCVEGTHLWKKQDSDRSKVSCRWDYHQTASHVIVAIYAKNYDAVESIIKLNPIRLHTYLVFPQENGTFSLDIELKGIIDIDKSKVTMFGSKVEISLKKAEAGSWSKLEVDRNLPEKEEALRDRKREDEDITKKVDAVDLSDI